MFSFSYNIFQKPFTKLGLENTDLYDKWLNALSNKMSVCKTVMPPYCHIDTGSGTVHLLISKELTGKY